MLPIALPTLPTSSSTLHEAGESDASHPARSGWSSQESSGQVKQSQHVTNAGENRQAARAEREASGCLRAPSQVSVAEFAEFWKNACLARKLAEIAPRHEESHFRKFHRLATLGGASGRLRSFCR